MGAAIAEVISWNAVYTRNNLLHTVVFLFYFTYVNNGAFWNKVTYRAEQMFVNA